jgi:quinol monooxygenase YgiN
MDLQCRVYDSSPLRGLSSGPSDPVPIDDQMLLRIVRGRVHDGRTSAFIDVCRRQVVEGARAPGLITFMGGYRRIGGDEEFALISAWESEHSATSATGGNDSARTAENLKDVATIDSTERYQLHPPVFEGILDAPGAVIRVTQATILPGKREALYAWLEQKEREIRTTRLLLGWAMGERVVDGEFQVTAASAWPSPLVIESLAEPGRAGMGLFAAVDEFVTDLQLVQYQAIELQLPRQLADVGLRRVLAARFDSESAANGARDALASTAESAAEAGISIARLASDTGLSVGDGEDRHVLVARVSLADYPQAERMIADHGGQVILAVDEKVPPS